MAVSKRRVKEAAVRDISDFPVKLYTAKESNAILLDTIECIRGCSSGAQQKVVCCSFERRTNGYSTVEIWTGGIVTKYRLSTKHRLDRMIRAVIHPTIADFAHVISISISNVPTERHFSEIIYLPKCQRVYLKQHDCKPTSSLHAITLKRLGKVGEAETMEIEILG
jgi:hypothetical protein